MPPAIGESACPSDAAGFKHYKCNGCWAQTATGRQHALVSIISSETSKATGYSGVLSQDLDGLHAVQDCHAKTVQL